jgi:hypothetical protein
MFAQGKYSIPAALAGLALGATLALPLAASADGGHRTLFITSAVEHPDNTVTLPLHRGLNRDGGEVWYLLLDTSDGKDAAALGINHSSKLTNARGTTAVMKVGVQPDGTVVFPAGVDFGANRVVVPGPNGFPPADAQPGAVGDPGYSPLIQLPDGTIRNAPQVANRTGHADKALEIDFSRHTVRYQETNGFQGGKAVKYVSTDSSDPGAAALENATYAPALNAAPFPGGDGTDSSRASLAAFVNGQTGAANPNRQGLNSAILDGLDPLNVLAWNPSQGRYSPLWDVHAAAWSESTVAAGFNLRQTDFGHVRELAQKGLVTGPGGAPFGPAGFIVDCPIVSSD